MEKTRNSQYILGSELDNKITTSTMFNLKKKQVYAFLPLSDSSIF